MKKSIKQLLSAVLVIAMMATLLVVPAAAAETAGGKDWDLKVADAEAFATAATGLTIQNGKYHGATYGMQIKPVLDAEGNVAQAATVGIPVDGPSTVTVYVGYTWDISLGDAQDPARWGNDAMPSGDNGKNVAKEFTYLGGAGVVTLTANKGTTSYIARITVAPLTGVTASKVDVWDMGAEKLDTTVFNNKLDEDTINGWYGDVAPGTSAKQLPATVTAGDFTYVGSKAGTRLRTSNKNLTRHDESNITKAELTPGEDAYDMVRGKHAGVMASNGATMTMKLQAQAGDKLTYVIGDGNNKSYDLVYTDPSGATVTYHHVTPPNGGSVATFYVAQTGETQVFGDSANSIRPCFARIYRESPKKATISGALTAPADIPSGYQVIFTDDVSGVEYPATVSGNNYSVEVNNYLSGTSYTLSVKNADGYIVGKGDTVALTAADAAKSHDVTLVKVDLATVSGKIVGLGAEDLANLAITVDVPEGKVYQPQVVITGDTYTTKFEKGETYGLTASYVNDYTLSADTYVVTADTEYNIVFNAKPVYAVTMDADPTTVDLTNATITFVNVKESDAAHEDGYTYTFTGADNIKLRDGQYSVKVEGVSAIQKLTPDLKVNGAAVTCTVPFQVETPTLWDFSEASWAEGPSSPTTYNGLTLSGVAVNKTYALTSGSGTSTITVPVPGPCKVVVSYCYRAVGTVGDVAFSLVEGEPAYGSTNTTEDATYTYTGAAGTVTVTTTGQTYFTKIEVKTSAEYKDTVTVGKGKDYATITDALDAVSKMDRPNNERVTIMIDPGDYEEQLWIDVPNVTLKNASATPSTDLKNKGVDIDDNAVRITHYYGHGYTYYSMTTNHRYSDEVLAVNKANGYPSFVNLGSGNQQGSYWNASVVVAADGFAADGIIFENSFNQYQSKKAANDVIVPQDGQAKEGAVARADMQAGDTTVQDKAYVERAAAIAMTNGEKTAEFNNCKFIGRQDTLDGGTDVKAAFYGCSIYGGTDYIMGPMTAAFVKCDLVLNTSDAEKDVAYITAPQQKAGVRGYLFYNCNVTSTQPGVDTASTKLSKPGTFGRPWDSNGEAVFYATNIGATDPSYFETQGTSLIQPAGWTNGLGGFSAATRMGEQGTLEADPALDNTEARKAAGFGKIYTDGKTADGQAFDPMTWFGDTTWKPFEGKDLTIVPERPEPELPGENEMTLSAKTVSVTVDAKKSVTATVTGYEGKAVYAVSEDTGIAIVAVKDKTVTVTGVAAGKTNVYVVMSDTSAITVEQAKADPSVQVLAVTVTAKSTGTGTSGRPSGSSSTTNPTTGNTVKKTSDRQGNVEITVTDPNGEVIADVKLPGSVPSVGYKFVDVPDDHWAAKSINNMAGLNMVKGVDDVNHIYDMNSATSRGAVATILFRLSQGKTGISESFADVASDAWYADGIAWAAKYGVVTGYDETTFAPDQAVTREQLAVMLYRYAKLLGMTTDTTTDMTKFADSANISSWASEAMTWAVASGIIKGKDAGVLDATAAATRAETAVMFDRFVSLMK